jgi:hypothetical protein
MNSIQTSRSALHLVHLCLLGVLLFGCSPRSPKVTEAEFQALQESERALNKFEQGVASYAHNVVSGTATSSIQNADKLVELVDGPIIKSSEGKEIRTNIRSAVVLTMLILEKTKPLFALAADISRGLEESRRLTLSGSFEEATKVNSQLKRMAAELETERKRILSDSSVTAAQQNLIELQAERKALFSKIRSQLER